MKSILLFSIISLGLSLTSTAKAEAFSGSVVAAEKLQSLLNRAPTADDEDKIVCDRTINGDESSSVLLVLEVDHIKHAYIVSYDGGGNKTKDQQVDPQDTALTGEVLKVCRQK